MRASIVLGSLIAASLAASSCGARRARVRTAGCVGVEQSATSLELRLGQRTPVAQPCPSMTESRIVGPIVLTATEDGLRIQLQVADPSYSPGRARAATDERGVAMVFPSGTGPGRSMVELAVEPIDGGYRVDDILPWTTWFPDDVRNLVPREQGFLLVCVLFDREESGGQSEIRLAMHVRVGSG